MTAHTVETTPPVQYSCPLCWGTKRIYGFGWEMYHESVHRWEKELADSPEDEQLIRFVAETKADKPSHDAEFRECPRCRGVGHLPAPDLCGAHEYADPHPAMFIVMEDYGSTPGTSKTKREPRLICAECASHRLEWRAESHPGEPPMVFALTPVTGNALKEGEH